MCTARDATSEVTRALARDERRGALILIADDCDDTRTTCAEFMALQGLRVEEARDGREAVRKALESRPDVVVMDISMPELDGLRATELLMASAGDVAVIAFSSDDSEETRARALRSGCRAFLRKPCLPDTVLKAVLDALATPCEPATP